jgi:hypothetical protein
MLLVALIGIVKTLVALLQKRSPTKSDQPLAAIFVGLYDLQVLSGLLIILLGGLKGAAHPIVMFIGVAAAHGLQKLTKRAEGNRAHLNRLLLYIVSLTIILVGLASLPPK